MSSHIISKTSEVSTSEVEKNSTIPCFRIFDSSSMNLKKEMLEQMSSQGLLFRIEKNLDKPIEENGSMYGILVGGSKYQNTTQQKKEGNIDESTIEHLTKTMQQIKKNYEDEIKKLQNQVEELRKQSK